MQYKLFLDRIYRWNTGANLAEITELKWTIFVCQVQLHVFRTCNTDISVAQSVLQYVYDSFSHLMKWIIVELPQLRVMKLNPISAKCDRTSALFFHATLSNPKQPLTYMCFLLEIRFCKPWKSDIKKKPKRPQDVCKINQTVKMC